MAKSILILKVHSDVCKNEMGLMEHHCELLGMESVSKIIKTKQELTETLGGYFQKSQSFDYLYLCTHGNKHGFDIKGDSDEVEDVNWHEFSQLLCETGILNEDAVLLLGCCKGGLFKVAVDIMSVCNKIEYVCGVTWNASPWDLTTGFIVFLHHMEKKNQQPSYSAKKASLATDYTFKCYDRDKAEMSPAYLARRNELFMEIGWVTPNGVWIMPNEQVIENVGAEVVNSYQRQLVKPSTGQRIQEN